MARSRCAQSRSIEAPDAAYEPSAEPARQQLHRRLFTLDDTGWDAKVSRSDRELKPSARPGEMRSNETFPWGTSRSRRVPRRLRERQKPALYSRCVTSLRCHASTCARQNCAPRLLAISRTPSQMHQACRDSARNYRWIGWTLTGYRRSEVFDLTAQFSALIARNTHAHRTLHTRSLSSFLVSKITVR